MQHFDRKIWREESTWSSRHIRGKNWTKKWSQDLNSECMDLHISLRIVPSSENTETNIRILRKARNFLNTWISRSFSRHTVVHSARDDSTHIEGPSLRGQQTPGTNRLLKQMDCLRLLRSNSNWGQLLRSSHVPVKPSGVLQGLAAATLSASVTLPGWRVTRGGRAPRTRGAIVSVTLGPRTFLLIV